MKLEGKDDMESIISLGVILMVPKHKRCRVAAYTAHCVEHT